MLKISTLVIFFLLCRAAVASELKIRVLDMSGNATPNAVISLSMANNATHTSTNLSGGQLEPAVMDQVDKQFSPKVLLVHKGQAVEFPNSDQVRHHVYSFSKPNDFEIRLYSGNQAEPVVFTHPGVVVLGCNIHDKMLGYLYVHDNELTGISDNNGVVTFSGASLNEIPNEQVVTIWHSQLSSNKTDRMTKLLQEKDENGTWVLRVALVSELKQTNRKFKPRFH